MKVDLNKAEFLAIYNDKKLKQADKLAALGLTLSEYKAACKILNLAPLRAKPRTINFVEDQTASEITDNVAAVPAA